MIQVPLKQKHLHNYSFTFPVVPHVLTLIFKVQGRGSHGKNFNLKFWWSSVNFQPLTCWINFNIENSTWKSVASNQMPFLSKVLFFPRQLLHLLWIYFYLLAVFVYASSPNISSEKYLLKNIIIRWEIYRLGSKFMMDK